MSASAPNPDAPPSLPAVRGSRPGVSGLVVVAMLLLAPAAPGAAAAQDPRETLAPDPLGVQLELNTSFHENLFQAPHGRPDTTVHAGGARVRLSEEWLSSLDGEAHVDGRLMVYRGFQPTYGTGGGLRIERWAQRLEFALDYDWWVPRLDVSGNASRADAGLVRADYRLRVGRLLGLYARGRYRWERFAGVQGRGPDEAEEPLRDDWRDHAFAEFEVAARTRVLGRLLSPEVGLARAGPREAEPAADYRQRQVYVQLRSAPHERLYLGARYRVRRRHYPTAGAESSNFEREDRRNQLTFLIDVTVTDSVSWIAYYAREDGVSSIPLRDFSTRMLSLGLKFRRAPR